jgi:hypothetical protein
MPNSDAKRLMAGTKTAAISESSQGGLRKCSVHCGNTANCPADIGYKTTIAWPSSSQSSDCTYSAIVAVLTSS